MTTGRSQRSIVGIPTRDAVIPSAVGVDIGCGMIASRLDLKADQLPDALDVLLPDLVEVEHTLRQVLNYKGV